MKLMVLALAILTFFNTSAHAYLGVSIPQPPAKGSAEELQDFIELHRVQDHRTPAECEAAAKQSNATPASLFGPQLGVLTREEFVRVQAFALRAVAETALITRYYKKYFKRNRPYVTDKTLTPCIPEVEAPDTSYPSGHASAAMAAAYAIAEKYPQKREAILALGRQVGANRVIGGVHYPSDVVAGQSIAKQVAKRLGYRVD